MVRISSMLVRALVVALERAGFERERFLTESGLDSRVLDDIHARIPLEDYMRAVHAVYAISGDPAFGLHLGERISTSSFDVLGHVVDQSASLRDALLVTVRYTGIVSEGPRVEFDEDGDRATLRFLLPESQSLAALLAAEFSTVAMLRLIRSFMGDDALPRQVCFEHAKPGHAVEYARLFAGRECFSCDFTGLVFDRAWLDQTLSWRDGELRGYLLNRAELLLAKAERTLSTVERVQRWLAAQPDLARPTLEAAARDLGLSARSLRRHLQHEHLQFSDLVDDSRATHAKRTLADTRQSIQETAYALGYRTPSAFSRAFKRWTGMTPRAYRDAL